MKFEETKPLPDSELESAVIQNPESAVKTAEKKEPDNESQSETSNMDNVYDLKTRLKLTTEEYQARLAANEEARKKLAVLGKKLDLGAAGDEEAMLKKAMEETQSKISSLEAALGQNGIEAGTEQ